MAEVFTSDNSAPTETVQLQEVDMADSLAVGEEIEAAHEQRLAGKYKNTEELEAAYLELQKKLGSNEEVEDVQTESEETPEVDWLAEAYNSISESGELSEELVQEISEMNGLDVFNAMQGQQPVGRDLSDGELGAVYQAVGGQEQYNTLIEWAGQNFTEGEIDAYDAVVETGDMKQINLALQALYYRYTDAMGQEGELLQGRPAQSQAGFRSQQELIEAMNDPRYDDDPAYRQDVLDKLDRSNVNF